MSSKNAPTIRQNFEIDHFDIGADYGVPEFVVPEVADALLEHLDEHGINPDSALFTGYSRALTDAQKMTAGLKLQEAHLNSNIVLDEPDILVTVPDPNKPITQLALPTYYFGGPASLRADAGAGANPIHFAGTGKGAKVDVYNLDALRHLSPELQQIPEAESIGEDIISVKALAKQLRPAHVLQFRPQYKPHRSR